MSDAFDALPEEARDGLRKQEQPRWTDPMLATLTDERFSNPDWIYERKLDGVRILAFRNGDDVRLMMRNERRRNAAYPEFVVGGFTDPQGERSGFGALLIGYYEDGALRYAGKVGTGYDKVAEDVVRERR